MGVFVKYSTRPMPQQSVFFTVRGKQGGRTEQSFKVKINVQVLVWLRYLRLEESPKWKELFFYVAKKIEHYFGGLRRNLIRV